MNKHCLHCRQALGFRAAVRGELFCSADHRELYLQARPTAVVERPMAVTEQLMPFEKASPEELMRVVERIKARQAARRAPASSRFSLRRLVRFWAPSSLAAGVAILALAATFFESSRAGTHPFAPLALAAAPRVDKAPPVDIPVPDPPLISLDMSEPAQSAAPASPATMRHVSIRVRETTWLAACSDGREVLRTVLSKGDTREIDFSQRAIVRVGNAGGTDISVDGKSIGSTGPDGALRVIELGLKGFHLLSLGPVDDGKDCGNH